jgi:hypothetical protein
MVSNPFVKQFIRGGDVPLEIRLMAAQGALPLKPRELLEILVHLCGDESRKVGEIASETMMAFPVAELLPIATDRTTPASVLAWIVTYRAEREVREAALQNWSLADDTIESLAPYLPQELAELVVINQERLLRRISLLEAIERNPNLNNGQQRRLCELRETFKLAKVAKSVDVRLTSITAAPESAPQPAQSAMTAPIDLSGDQALARVLSEEEGQQAENVDVAQGLNRLSIKEKIMTALKGTREERAVLVRDPNRLVAAAVLGSPELSLSEVEAFAWMRGVPGETLREIGTDRGWTDSYVVTLGLVFNPSTPLPTSLGLIPKLLRNDLLRAASNRDVPELVRSRAGRIIEESPPAIQRPE